MVKQSALIIALGALIGCPITAFAAAGMESAMAVANSALRGANFIIFLPLRAVAGWSPADRLAGFTRRVSAGPALAAPPAQTLYSSGFLESATSSSWLKVSPLSVRPPILMEAVFCSTSERRDQRRMHWASDPEQ